MKGHFFLLRYPGKRCFLRKDKCSRKALSGARRLFLMRFSESTKKLFQIKNWSRFFVKRTVYEISGFKVSLKSQKTAKKAKIGNSYEFFKAHTNLKSEIWIFQIYRIQKVLPSKAIWKIQISDFEFLWPFKNS